MNQWKYYSADLQKICNIVGPKTQGIRENNQFVVSTLTDNFYYLLIS